KHRLACLFDRINKSFDLLNTDKAPLSFGYSDNDRDIKLFCRANDSPETFDVRNIKMTDRYFLLKCLFYIFAQGFHGPIISNKKPAAVRQARNQFFKGNT